jgi:hypothetical protein
MTFTAPTKPISDPPSDVNGHIEEEDRLLRSEDQAASTPEAPVATKNASGKRLEDDLTWFLSNLKEISAELGERFVAVQDHRVVAHAETMPELREQLKQLAIERPLITRSGLKSWELVRW